MSNAWSERRVVVTGLGCASPLGLDADTVWKNILAGKCGVGRVGAFDISAYDCQIAAEVRGFDPVPAFPSPKEVRRSDRFTHFGVYAGWGALKDSGLNLEIENRDDIGVYIGSGIGGLHTTEEQHKVLLAKGPLGLVRSLQQLARPQFRHVFGLRHEQPRHWRGLVGDQARRCVGHVRWRHRGHRRALGYEWVCGHEGHVHPQ